MHLKRSLFYDSFQFNEIKRGSYTYSDNRNGSPWHYVAYMLEGRCRIVSDHEVLEVNAGDVFYIPMGLPYQSYWYGDPEVRFLSFAFRFFPESENTAYALQVVPCSESQKQTLSAAIPAEKVSGCRMFANFYTALADLLPSFCEKETSRSDKIFSLAKQHLQETPHVSAASLARYCNVSESTLYAAFKQNGTTPTTVKQQILCEKATLLLVTTNKSVQEISDSLGFSSTAYFRKTLKQYTQKTPREIRRETRSM